MDFTDVINDLIKMEGLRLNSIRPGAEIVIEKVDVEQKRLTIRNASGKIQNRYFTELERIWEALIANPAIRVEDVLNGSGSSRNQPETIFANLPYVQWLKIDNKKHITYVGKSTHPLGTIQKMDSMKAAEVSNSSNDEIHRKLVAMIVSDNVSRTAQTITSATGKTGHGASEGYYIYELKNQYLVLIDSNKAQIPCGTYAELLQSSIIQPKYKMAFLDQTWSIICEDNFKAIVRS